MGGVSTAQIGTVRGEEKIVFEARAIDQPAFPNARFGSATAFPGDLDGDGNVDLAVGVYEDDEGGPNQGAVWILFMDSDGTVKAEQKINTVSGGFGGTLDADFFGWALAPIGDLDGDGIPDLAVGAPWSGDGGLYNGAVWILFMDSDGTVKAEQKISELAGGFGGNLDGNRFGSSVANLGDLDGDGVVDLAVGAAAFQGNAWILFLQSDGTVKAEQEIGEGIGGFGGALDDGDSFGFSVAAPGDLDGDGIVDLAIGAPGDDGGDPSEGAVWILFLAADGTVQSEHKIAEGAGGFTGTFSSGDSFGSALSALGDLNGDGLFDVAVGAYSDDDAGNDRGAVYVLFLEADGTVGSHQRIGHSFGGFGPGLDPIDNFGSSVASAGDLDGNGTSDLAVGAPGDDDGSPDLGAVWIVYLNADGTVLSRKKIGDPLDAFGRAVAALGDLDGDGNGDLAVASLGVDGGADRGEVWILFLDADGTVKSRQEIGDAQGGFTGALDDYDGFGSSIAALGDLDGDGNVDLAVGANGDDDGGQDQGALWILYLESDGTVGAQQKISETAGGFGGVLDPSDGFGAAVASLGDLDGDGVEDLALGAPGDDDGGSGQGAIWILFLDSDGTVRTQQKISETAGGFGGVLDPDNFAGPGDSFGMALAPLGDLDGDGIEDLAAGTGNDDDGLPNQGAVWILFLDADGTVKSEQKISEIAGGFGGTLRANDAFGIAVAALGDLDGDGIVDLAAGANADDDGGPNQGALWILFLQADGTVRAEQKISELQGGFASALHPGDFLGTSVTALGDLDGDGVTELASGAYQDRDVDLRHGAAWVLFLKGAVRLGFETEDDFETPLADGQDLASPAELGRLVSLSSSGANAGAAIFDSTLGGPNGSGPDPDLLVGTGNLVILQADENATQTVPGFFDQPDDDGDGGVLTFDFAAPVEPQALDLVDIESGAGQGATVTLTTTSGRRRIFVVPPGWTGDRLLGGPGRQTLDLTALSPQSGYAASAAALETRGFEPSQVVRMEIELSGDGALDNLVWCPSSSRAARPGPRALYR